MGMGLVIKCGASTGGTDILAIIFNRKWGDFRRASHVPYRRRHSAFPRCFLQKERIRCFLGIGLTFLYSMVADKVVVAGSGAVRLMIISSRYEDIRQSLVDHIVGNTVFLRRNRISQAETGYTSLRDFRKRSEQGSA